MEAKQEREEKSAKAKKLRKCMKQYEGRFLCPETSTWLCENKCGWKPECPCCIYPKEERKKMCEERTE